MTPPESTASPTPFVDRAQADRTARQLYAEYGVGALYEAQEQLFKADAENRPNDVAFWQAVTRALVDPGIANSLLRF